LNVPPRENVRTFFFGTVTSSVRNIAVEEFDYTICSLSCSAPAEGKPRGMLALSVSEVKATAAFDAEFDVKVSSFGLVSASIASNVGKPSRVHVSLEGSLTVIVPFSVSADGDLKIHMDADEATCVPTFNCKLRLSPSVASPLFFRRVTFLSTTRSSL